MKKKYHSIIFVSRLLRKYLPTSVFIKKNCGIGPFTLKTFKPVQVFNYEYYEITVTCTFLLLFIVIKRQCVFVSGNFLYN